MLTRDSRLARPRTFTFASVRSGAAVSKKNSVLLASAVATLIRRRDSRGSIEQELLWAWARRSGPIIHSPFCRRTHHRHGSILTSTGRSRAQNYFVHEEKRLELSS